MHLVSWPPPSPPLYKDTLRPSQLILRLLSHILHTTFYIISLIHLSLVHLSPKFGHPILLPSLSLSQAALSSHLLHLRRSPIIEVSSIFPEGCVNPSHTTFAHKGQEAMVRAGDRLWYWSWGS